MFRCVFTTLVFLYVVREINSADILAVIPSPSKRHQKVLNPIWQQLSVKGHRVTLLTNISKYSDFQNSKLGVKSDVKQLNFSKDSIKQLLGGKNKFDLVIVDSLMPEYLAFADYYKSPNILISAGKTNNFIHSIMGNVPYPLKTENHTCLSLFQRTVAFFNYYSHFALEYLWTKPAKHQLLKKHFGPDIGSPSKIFNNVDILLMNFNPIFHDIVNVGPATATFTASISRKRARALPKDLQEYLDGATEGFIYFSLGTNSKSVFMEPSKIKSIMEALSELPYKILWKFESDDITDLPKNIKIISWGPQQDILRHPNIKLFITQGGIQSLEEAIVNHVPMVMLPIYGDQEANAKRMELRGISKIIPHKPVLNKEEFKRIVLETISNPQYKENIIKAAKLLQDQPMGGVEKAVWWIEYVIRHKGAKHLRNPALDVPFYQFYSLDVIVLLILLCCILFKIISFIMNLFLGLMGTLKEKQN